MPRYLRLQLTELQIRCEILDLLDAATVVMTVPDISAQLRVPEKQIRHALDHLVITEEVFRRTVPGAEGRVRRVTVYATTPFHQLQEVRHVLDSQAD